MKYKKRYNFLFTFLFIIIAASITLSCTLNLDHVESQGDANILEYIEQDQNKEVVESSTMKEVSFNQFSTAVKYANNYLKKVGSYSSYTYGVININVINLVNISQNIGILSVVNNSEKKTSTKICTYGNGKINTKTGWEFTKIGNQVSFRKSNDQTANNEFIYDNKDVTRLNTSEFLKEWGMLPNQVFVGFDASNVDGTITLSRHNKEKYKLTFSIDDSKVINNNHFFIKRFFDNSANSQNVKIKFDNINVEMTLDKYGRPIKAIFTLPFHDLDLSDVGIPLTSLNGSVSYTQEFYDYGVATNIQPMPDKV